MRADDIVFEYRFTELKFSNKIRKTCEIEEDKNNSHIAGWLKNVNMDNAILVRIQCEVVYFFLFCYFVFPLNFVKIFLAYGRRYPLEILTATEVIDHAESEYAIFIFWEPTLQNPSILICMLFSNTTTMMLSYCTEKLVSIIYC